jgi:uncharacterized protein YbjQ (UPF0145 family)
MRWTCQSCREIHEEQFDSCWKCGTVRSNAPLLSAISEEIDDRPPPSAEDIPCSTTPTIPGREIIDIKGIVCGEAIMGANILRDFVAGLSDIVGGRVGVYETKLREGRKIALQEMKQEALDLGANAVIGVDIDYETVGDTMMMISISGTAVVLQSDHHSPPGC